jgi:hypothetical protein
MLRVMKVTLTFKELKMPKYEVVFDDDRSYKVWSSNIYAADCDAAKIHYEKFYVDGYVRPKTKSISELEVLEWEIIFADGESFVVEADDPFDAIADAETEYLNKFQDPFDMINGNIELPMVRSCTVI